MKHYNIAAAVIRQADEVLMVRQEYLDAPGSFYWTFPAGRLEPGETFLEGILREIREETGLCVERPSRLIYTCEYRNPGESCMVAMYEFTAFTGTPEPQDPDGEVLEARFFPVEAATAHIEALRWEVIRGPNLAHLKAARAESEILHWRYAAERGGGYRLLDALPHDAETCARFLPAR